MFGWGGGPKNVIMDQSGRAKKNQSDSGQAPKIFFSGREQWAEKEMGKGGQGSQSCERGGYRRR